MRPMAAGAAAGLVATAAMTAAMLAMFRRLPADQRYPLPPAEITTVMKSRAGGEEATRGETLAAHFAYGAVFGALFPVLARQRSAGAGVLYGLAVWSGSYLGWLPAFGVLKPATRHPARRNALMLLAHAVWGWTLAASARTFSSPEREREEDVPEKGEWGE